MRAPDFPGDGPPRHAPDLSHVPDAVPRIEPLSRGGNPDSYVVLGRRYHVLDSSAGFVEQGTASWYGRKFHGRRTSNGEIYDMYRMTAAHKHLPLPTYVRVSNLENGRSVVVRVNDRGPFHAGRVIDLSYAAASKLGMLGRGTARVEVRAIDPRRPTATRVAAIPQSPPQTAPATTTSTPGMAVPNPPPPAPRPAGRTAPGLFLQAGAFASEYNARRLQARLSRDLEHGVRIAPAERAGVPIYRVQVGPLGSIRHADLLTAELERLGVVDPRVVFD